MFKKIELGKWRQFDSVDIEFHPRLTILTGANGSGKTTILTLLNNHFGWPLSFIGTPKKSKISGLFEYVTDVWRSFFSSQESQNFKIGNIEYKNGKNCELRLPKGSGEVYGIQYGSKNGMKGLHIPSHRPIYSYKKVENIPTKPFTKSDAFQKYSNAVKRRFQGSHSETANFHIKETLISLGTFGYGNEVVQRNDESVRIFSEFQEVLKIVLPPKLGFEKIEIRMPEVVLVTRSGDFSLDAVSGGIAAIIDLSWQIFTLNDNLDEDIVVTIDEPENHLHPEMQKTLFPNFLKAFPNVQFITATHNPFIISSEPDSNVYVLDYDNDNKVNSIYLETVEKAGTANEILRDVLGIDSATPLWVNNKVDQIIEKYSKSGITKENLNSFKDELKEVGLEKHIPTSIANLIDRTT